MGGSVTATWTGSHSGDPVVNTAAAPGLSPLAVPVTNTAGQWLIAVASWRQDAGTAGSLQYPSTVTICDDAHNFWIPVQVVPASTGVVRCTVWMAPAARAAQYVFACPTDFQAALALTVLEVTADCPWYSVAAVVTSSANQASSVTASQDPASGLFSVGVISWDLNAATVTLTDTGWLDWNTVTTSNGTDATGDLTQVTFLATTSGSTMTLAASATGGTPDFGEVIVTIHGISDNLAFPYTVPLENWPVLITEIGSGQILNANPYFASGTTDWTAAGGAVAAVTWPLYVPWPLNMPGWAGSVSLTPSGSAATSSITSETEAVSATGLYQASAWVYSTAGWGACSVAISWNSGSSTTTGTVTAVPAGEWTLLSFASPVTPPAGTTTGQVVVQETIASGNIPASAVLYIGYAGLSPAMSWQSVPPDEISWTDLSSRNLTIADFSVGRSVQYEQQSLEAGTMTVTMRNTDALLTTGNWQSALWPAAGDTDVPVRLRAVWPLSLTPYSVLHSGLTDQIVFGWDEETWYGYAEITASDGWSRLTAQMLTCDQQEVLSDNPIAYFTCSGSGSNQVPGATSPILQVTSQSSAGTASGSFASQVQAQALQGATGQSCWAVTGLTAVGGPSYQGLALAWFPQAGPQGLPPVSGGITVEFWASPQSGAAGQSTSQLHLCTCWSGNGPVWTLFIDNSGGGSGVLKIEVFTPAGAGTTYSFGVLDYLTAPADWYFFTVSFTTTTLTATSSGTTFVVSETVNLNSVISGFSFGGDWAPTASLNQYFMNGAFYGIAFFSGTVPLARLAVHQEAAQTAFPAESDNTRLARVAGYAGFTLPLAMRGLDLATPPAADIDIVTAATDTSGQVASAYFTNIAQSTLAAMFMDGPGALVYRRRAEWYDRVPAQWALGQAVPQPVNVNGTFQNGTTGWSAQNSATLSAAVLPAGMPSPLFTYTGLFHGSGSVATPQVAYGSASTTPVSPGHWYALMALAWSPQGYASGIQAQVQYLSAGAAVLSSATSLVTALAAGSLTFLAIPPSQAPQGAAYAVIYLTGQGTPASSVQFYISQVTLSEQGTVTAGGPGATAPDVPYLPAVRQSTDRALLFNQAIINQYGTMTQATFSGTSFVFQPTDGVTVIVTNAASVNKRAAIPYTVTVYLDNTAQQLPYYLDEASIEDIGAWVVYTSGSPQLRPETVTITPAATPAGTRGGVTSPAQSMQMALQAEIADTASFRRQPLGVPVMRVAAWLSAIRHRGNLEAGQWEVQYELTPFPGASILRCDDPLRGCLTGGNYLGF